MNNFEEWARGFVGPFPLNRSDLRFAKPMNDVDSRERPSTVWEIVNLRAHRVPDSVAITYELPLGGFRSIRWSEFYKSIVKACHSLGALGISSKDFVVTLQPSGLANEVTFYALMKAGAVPVGLDSNTRPEELEFILERCGASILIADAIWTATHASFVHQKLRGFTVISVDSRQGSPYDFTLVSGASALAVTRCEKDTIAPLASDKATVIFTSGTTGEPKGICFSHAQIVAAVDALAGAFDELGESDRTISWLPTTSLFQRMVNLVSVSRGMEVCFVEHPKEIFRYVLQLQPTFLIGVPRFFEKMCDWVQGAGGKEFMDAAQKLKFSISGSAALSVDVLRNLADHGVLVMEAYGLSENAIPIAVNRLSDFRFGSVGKPLKPNLVRIASDGEVEVKGPGLFAGYLGDASTECFTKDGYYQTGDLGEFDSGGFLYLKGRKKDLIKTSTGRRISPSKVEATYRQCRWIDQILVFGDDQKYLVALIYLKNEPARSNQCSYIGFLENDVMAELSRAGEALNHFEQVQVFGVLPAPFQGDEVTSNQKLRRQVIARKYANFLKKLYEAPEKSILAAEAIDVVQ